jgi:hypothetical protein
MPLSLIFNGFIAMFLHAVWAMLYEAQRHNAIIQ